MSPRPDWLRVVEGGAASSEDSPPPSARPSSPRASLRRSGAHRCATPLPLPDRTLNVEEHASFRWNASPWVKWMPAVLACSVLSGAMLWNVGRLWFERADSTAFAWRPTNVYLTDAEPGKPARKAPSVKGPSDASEEAVKQAARRPPAIPASPPASPEPADTLGLLAAASFLAAMPPTPAPAANRPVDAPAEPPATPKVERRHMEQPATPALDPRPAPVQRREHVIRVISVHDPVQNEVVLDAEVEELAALFDGLSEDAKKSLLETLSREVHAYYGGSQRPAAPAASGPRTDPPTGPLPPGFRVADEGKCLTTGDREHRILLYEDGGLLRIRLPKLAAPATPKG